jgi:HAD superfamily phosphoserine phosphatase-like hydrolase
MMNKPVAVFDIDGTIFRSNLVVELVEALIIQGTFPASSRFEIQESYQDWKMKRDRVSYVNYIDSIVQTYLKYIKGIPVHAVKTAVDTVMRKAPEQIYVYSRNLLNEIKDSHCLIAISGSPAEIVEPFVKELGFTDYYSSNYEVIDHAYTGNARAGHHDKDKTLVRLVKKHKLTFKNSIGMGDTDADISMLELVEKPIAFNPNKELLEHALNKGWEIISEHKDTILHLNNGKFKLIDNFGHYFSI